MVPLNELLAYNIRVDLISLEQLFPSEPNPSESLDSLDPALLTARAGAHDSELSHPTVKYLACLDLATKHMQESFSVAFARETLDVLGFSERNKLLCTWYTIPLAISGATRPAETAVCLLHRPTLVLLIVVEGSSTTDPCARAIASAIAAFQFNNDKRFEGGLQPLESATVLCITMSDTRPTFYLVPVTYALGNGGGDGAVPPDGDRCVDVRYPAACTVAEGGGGNGGHGVPKARAAALPRV
ncbi:hypothetical protein FB451DRAFT_1225413 [Mycena latifolia]|nr:hypothetical protein FB451DRAFT_1225413 [Mycena latifolia]